MSDSILKVENVDSLNNRGIGFEDGNSSNPGINFSKDVDTGIYRIGSNIIGISSNGNKVGEIGADYGGFIGGIIQHKILRYDSFTSVATGTSNDGVEITPLRISITPKFRNSMILCMFQVFGEGLVTHNYIMRVFKNGSTITGNYPGFNREAGNVAWSGIAMSLPFEENYASTPHQVIFYYHDFPNTTDPVVYGPGIKESGNVNYTYFINRPATSAGAVNNENGVSFSMVWEIMQ